MCAYQLQQYKNKDAVTFWTNLSRLLQKYLNELQKVSLSFIRQLCFFHSVFEIEDL
jgi:hypothetical protein